MESLWKIVSGAPWWVYILFAYVVSIGIKAIKPRTVPVKRVVMLPLLFVAWSFYNLYARLALGYMSLLPLWVVCLGLGACLGVLEVRDWKIAKDRHKGELTIPGNYSTLVLILLIFVLKFFWGYFYATHTTISYRVYFWDVLTSSLVTGFFVGRAWLFFKRYRSKS
jgi:hypothetical protein